MSEALRNPTVASPYQHVDRPVELSSMVTPVEVNDNEVKALPERRSFELPARVWVAMVGCYVIFLTALLGATGGANAAFAIAISAVYVVMFFGTAWALVRQGPPQPASNLGRPGAVLQTAFGPVAYREVVGQVLIVPAAVACFGIAIAVISAFVF
jgi:hypothetical protein